MKRKQVVKLLLAFLVLFSLIGLTSFTYISKGKLEKIQVNKTYPAHPIKMEKFTQGGMVYMAFSRSGGGVTIVNLTLDKEKYKYYKLENE